MSLTIGQVAERVGIGVETIRFYEREVLLDKPKRSASGYRQYDEGVVDRIQFILRAKELGFTLRQIKELLDLRIAPNKSCAEVKNRAEAKLKDIQAKIQSLQRMKRALVKLTKVCSGRGRATECSILDTLERGSS